MNRIDCCLSSLKQAGRKALVTYLVVGDPRLDVSLDAMHALVAAGADILELGIAFSDPMAEGPVIQRGHERALAQGATLLRTLDLVRQFRQTDTTTPIVLMGYANPVERMGYETLASKAREVGVDGLLTVDLPPEEAHDLQAALHAKDIKSIFLLAPTTTDGRMDAVAALASGFIYYVSLKGVTGAGNLDTQAVKSKLDQIRQHTRLPLMVGFGIKDADSAKAVATCADGVVVGSVLVDAMGSMVDKDNAQICAALSDIVKPIRQAIDAIVAS